MQPNRLRHHALLGNVSSRTRADSRMCISTHEILVYASTCCNTSCCMGLNVQRHEHWGAYDSVLLRYTAYSYEQTSISHSDELNSFKT